MVTVAIATWNEGRLSGGPLIDVRMVGARGFEPPTTYTPSKCATRLRHAPTSEAADGRDERSSRASVG